MIMFNKINRVCGYVNTRNTIKGQVNNVSSIILCGDNINPILQSERYRSTALSYNIIPQPQKTVSEQERQEFKSFLPTVIKDLTGSYYNIPEVTDRYIEVLKYNLPNHKQAPGLMVVSGYKMFESAENLTPKKIHLANILGWCADLVICSFQINDDFMDGSEIRRGLACWYTKEGVGKQAINDAVLIENGPFILLKKYFSERNCYFPCVEWIHEVMLGIALGQSLDTMNRLNGKPNLEAFSMSRFKLLAKFRGTYGQYLLPIRLALYFAENYTISFYTHVQNILFDLGEYFTAQNDILDCYGDPLITGKVGSDIGAGKCSWLVITALQRATRAQRQILSEHYGRSEPESYLKVRSLYNELNILDNFLKYEEESYKKIYQDIQQISDSKTQEFLLKLVETTYGR